MSTALGLANARVRPVPSVHEPHELPTCVEALLDSWTRTRSPVSATLMHQGFHRNSPQPHPAEARWSASLAAFHTSIDAGADGFAHSSTNAILSFRL